MKNVKRILIFALILMLFSISSVCASDVNDTAIDSDDKCVNVVEIENQDEVVNEVEGNQMILSSNDDMIDSDSIEWIYKADNNSDNQLTNSIEELSELIENVPENGNLYLENDYELERGDKIVISKAITIDGKNHFISGSTMEILFNITNSNATLKNIVFKNSYPNKPLIQGGTLENCTFINFNRHSCFVAGTAYNCMFINCSSPVDSARGLYNCKFINCSGGSGVVSNTSVYKCSFINCHARYGGAVYDCQVDNCSFINCYATNGGGAIYYEHDNHNVTDSCFINCSSSQGVVSFASVYNCKFDNCDGSAVYSGEAYDSNFINCQGDYGGAVRGKNVYRCKFINCSAINGGALYGGDAYNSTFENCYSQTIGGAASFSSVYNCSFINCSAGEDGGAVYNGNIVKSTLINCSAAGAGGAFYSDSINYNITNSKFNGCNAAYGGAVLSVYGTRIYNSTFLNCHASEKGGASNRGNSYNCSFVNCSANYGGAVYDCQVDNCSFIECSAIDGGSIYGSSNKVYNSRFIMCYASHDAGAVYCEVWNDINNSTFFNCTSENEAGAINKGSINNCTFDNCTSKHGFALISGYLSNCYFINCYAGYATLKIDVKNVTSENEDVVIKIHSIGNGVANITVNNISYTVDINDGVGELTISNLTPGTYIVNAVCNTNGYVPANNSSSFKVKEMYITDINLSTQKRLIPGIGFLIISLDERINGTVIFTRDEMDIPVRIINGEGKIGFDDLEVGVTEVTLTFSGNDDFLPVTKKTFFNVFENPKLKIFLPDTISSTDDFIFKLSTDVESFSKYNYITVILISGNETIETNVSGWKENNKFIPVNLGVLDAGEYCVVINYDGYGDYGASSLTKNFTVLNNPNLVVSVNNISYGEIAVVNISIDERIVGNLVVRVDGIVQEITLSKGQCTIPLSNLSAGNHSVRATFGGDNLFVSKNIETVFNVAEIQQNKTIEPEIIIPSLDEYSNDEFVEVKLSSDATGTVTLTVNGNEYNFDVVNGVANIKLPELEDGVYPYTITYSGDSKYSSFTESGSMKVNKTCVKPVENQTGNTTPDIAVGDNSKIVASNVKAIYAAGLYYTIKVYGTDGNLADGVTVKLTGKISKTLTTTKGVAKFKVTQVPGTYKITITALGKSVTKTLTVKHVVTLKTATVKKSAKKLVLQATLAKVNGKVLKNKKVTFKFNGKKYTAKTNAKGVVKVTIKSSVLKKLKVGKKVTYQATYLKDTVKKSVKIKK